MSFSLLIPAAGIPKGGDSLMPRVFMPDAEGVMLCVRAIMGLNLEAFNRIVFTVLKSHVEKFDVDTLLSLQFKRLGIKNAEILVLDQPTNNQPETIYKTIKATGIEGAVFFKDADCFFEAEVYPENGVAVCPLESLPVVDPRNKSYVAIDDMQHITNIIEKKIINNLFNAGGYCFADVTDFIEGYEKYASLGNIYLSHIIYGMLLDGHTFRPIETRNYKDWNL